MQSYDHQEHELVFDYWEAGASCAESERPS
jgi:hypothetical protein